MLYSCSVSVAYANQRKIDNEAKTLQMNAATFARQTALWLKSMEEFSSALKVENCLWYHSGVCACVSESHGQYIIPEDINLNLSRGVNQLMLSSKLDHWTNFQVHPNNVIVAVPTSLVDGVVLPWVYIMYILYRARWAKGCISFIDWCFIGDWWCGKLVQEYRGGYDHSFISIGIHLQR